MANMSFNEIDWKRQELEDEQSLQALINAQPDDQSGNALFDMDRPLENGEKADDAEDFEDIGDDDDLPEEEEATLPADGEVPGLTDDAGTSHDTDDLFGEGEGFGSSPYDDDAGDLFGPPEPEEPEDLMALNFPEAHRSNQDPNIPEAAESNAELFAQLFPSFKKGGILNFNVLAGPGPVYYPVKTPLKPPKPVAPTKISLELAPDQEKAFRAPGTAQADKQKWILDAEARGLVPIIEETMDDVSEEEDFDYSLPDPSEKIGGLSWGDIAVICDDWDSKINPVRVDELQEIEDEPMDEWEREILGPTAKRRKITPQETDFINTPRYAVPSFDNFEADTARIAKRVVLDLNDPYLLVDVQKFNPRNKQPGRGKKRGRENGFTSSSRPDSTTRMMRLTTRSRRITNTRFERSSTTWLSNIVCLPLSCNGHIIGSNSILVMLEHSIDLHYNVKSLLVLPYTSRSLGHKRRRPLKENQYRRYLRRART